MAKAGNFASKRTYIVSGGALNSITHSLKAGNERQLCATFCRNHVYKDYSFSLPDKCSTCIPGPYLFIMDILRNHYDHKVSNGAKRLYSDPVQWNNSAKLHERTVVDAEHWSVPLQLPRHLRLFFRRTSL